MKYYISKYSVYILLFCFSYLIQRTLFISLLKLPRILCWDTIYLHEIVFVVTSFIFVKNCFRIDRLE